MQNLKHHNEHVNLHQLHLKEFKLMIFPKVSINDLWNVHEAFFVAFFGISGPFPRQNAFQKNFIRLFGSRHVCFCFKLRGFCVNIWIWVIIFLLLHLFYYHLLFNGSSQCFMICQKLNNYLKLPWQKIFNLSSDTLLWLADSSKMGRCIFHDRVSLFPYL
jgi:hypothetical protein